MPHLLQKMHWLLLKAKGREFITSDHPIVFPRAPGIGIGIETTPIIFFPIDPYRVIILTRERRWKSGHMSRQIIPYINQMIADNCYEWIAYHPDQKDALSGITITEPDPMFSINGAPIYASGSGMDEAMQGVRGIIEGVKQSGQRRAAQPRKGSRPTSKKSR